MNDEALPDRWTRWSVEKGGYEERKCICLNCKVYLSKFKNVFTTTSWMMRHSLTDEVVAALERVDTRTGYGHFNVSRKWYKKHHHYWCLAFKNTREEKKCIIKMFELKRIASLTLKYFSFKTLSNWDICGCFSFVNMNLEGWHFVDGIK